VTNESRRGGGTLAAARDNNRSGQVDDPETTAVRRKRKGDVGAYFAHRRRPLSTLQAELARAGQTVALRPIPSLARLKFMELPPPLSEDDGEPP
jgi:hypothetical protein